MDKIPVVNIFAAVFDKKVLDGLLEGLDKNTVRFFGTEGTVNYLVEKGFVAESVVRGFDFDGRVKSLDRNNFVRILADRTKEVHVDELKKMGVVPYDLVIVDLYAPEKSIFPESMDIGGQSLIRSAVKNYKNVAVAYDAESIDKLAEHVKSNDGSTTLDFRKQQAVGAADFIANRCKMEADYFKDL